MQTQLYLARHAHAVDDAPSDGARYLSPKGHKQMERLTHGLRASKLLAPEVIWQSGLVRAKETAVALKEGLDLKVPMIKKRGLAPYDDPSAIGKLLHELPHSCLVVGHEPNLSSLASLLLVGDQSFNRIRFPKASILCLSRLQVTGQATPWQIEWHISHHFYKDS